MGLQRLCLRLYRCWSWRSRDTIKFGQWPTSYERCGQFPSSSRLCRLHPRFCASSRETGRPACAYPINRRTTPNPAGVRSPRSSLSAICQICVICVCQREAWTSTVQSNATSPSTSGGSRVFSRNFTATSPVTTPIFSLSAAENNWPKRRRSSGLRCRLGCSGIQIQSDSAN